MSIDTLFNNWPEELALSDEQVEKVRNRVEYQYAKLGDRAPGVVSMKGSSAYRDPDGKEALDAALLFRPELDAVPTQEAAVMVLEDEECYRFYNSTFVHKYAPMVCDPEEARSIPVEFMAGWMAEHHDNLNPSKIAASILMLVEHGAGPIIILGQLEGGRTFLIYGHEMLAAAFMIGYPAAAIRLTPSQTDECLLIVKPKAQADE